MKRVLSLVLIVLMIISFIPMVAEEVYAAEEQWLWPTETSRMNTGWITQKSKSGHLALDIGGTHGQSPIYAAKSGTVAISYNGCTCRSDNGKNGILPGGSKCRHGKSAGNYVVINHGGGVYTRYLHLHWMGIPAAGKAVKQGEIIGYMGSTGNSTGVHLHFDIWNGGTGASGGTVLGGSRISCNPKNVYSNGDMTYITSANEGHTHSYTRTNESAHPHQNYEYCSCGAKSYIASFNKQSSCKRCYPVGSVKLTRSANKTERTATIYRNHVTNANSYTLTLYRNGSTYGTYTMSSTSYSLSGLASGTYTATLTARNTSTGESRSASCSSFTIVDTYTVSYNANGGSGAPSSQTKIQGEALTLSSSAPKRTGYIFKGWASSKNATTAQYPSGGKYTKNAKITLYAVWEPETYTITFDANGGKGELQNAMITYGNTLRMPNTVVRDIYYLRGWSTSASATEPDYKLGLDYKLTSNTTLYAVWGSSTWGGAVSGSLAGSGTESDPYQIATAADLAYLANKVNSQSAAPVYEYYQLTDNINLGYKEWVPIGLYENTNQYFYGSFDGNGYTISDLYVTAVNAGYVGLFGYMKESEVKNLTVVGAIENIATSGTSYIGGVAGYAEKTTISQSAVNYFNIANITAGTTDYTRMGAIAGQLNGGEVTDCSVTDSHIDLKSGSFYAGMIAGYSTGKLVHCSVSASEGGLFSSASTVGAFSLGGLCGQLHGQATNCTVAAPYLTNSLKTGGSANIGGLVGYLYGSLKVCSAKFTDGGGSGSSISTDGAGTVYAGGLAGEFAASATVADCQYDGQSIAAATTSGYPSVGGLLGYATAARPTTVSISGGQSLSKGALPTREGYKATWYTDVDFTTPYDFAQTVTGDMTLYAMQEKVKEKAGWDGTAKEPVYDAEAKTYTITNGNELAWIARVANGAITTGTNFPVDISFNGYTIKLADEIYLNTISGYENWGTTPPANSWTSISDFKGTFEGEGKSINGLYPNPLFDINNGTVQKLEIRNSFLAGDNGIGVISITNNGTISNCINASIVQSSKNNTGGITGINTSSGIVSNSINYGAVTNAFVDLGEEFSENNDTGGITGLNQGTIQDCHNFGMVTGQNAGGIAGNSSNGSIKKSSNSGTVNGTKWSETHGTGGIVARSNETDISYCYNKGTINGYGNVGGIVGLSKGGTVISYCYNLSNISAKGSLGGIVGQGHSDTVKYCYNHGALTGVQNDIGGICGYGVSMEIIICYSRASIQGYQRIGGIAGLLKESNTVSGCYHVGTLSCTYNEGSIVGMMDETADTKVSNCMGMWPIYREGSGNAVSSSNNCTISSYDEIKNKYENYVGSSVQTYSRDNTSYNNGFPYLMPLLQSYKNYTVTVIEDVDKAAISRSFANVDGSITAKASSYGYAGGIVGRAYGIASAASTARQLLTIADSVDASGTGNSYGGYVLGQNSNNRFTFENAYYSSEMTIGANVKVTDTTGTARSTRLMKLSSFLTSNIGLKPYTSLANLEEDETAVWVIKDGELPDLYHNRLNDITVSKDIVGGTVAVDRTQAVDGEVVNVTATPEKGYALNKLYVNGTEVAGTTFEVSGDSELYAVFSEEIPVYDVSITADDNAAASLTNVDAGAIALADAGGISLYSGAEALTANDGEEIRVDTTADTDYTVDAVYVNGEELAGDSFILAADSVVTLAVSSISTEVTAVTNEPDYVGSYEAILSGSVSGDGDGAARYIRYWKAESPDEIYVTEVEAGAGDYQTQLTMLEVETTYQYQMTEYGEIKTFTTLEEPDDIHIVDGDDTTVLTLDGTYVASASSYTFTVTCSQAVESGRIFVGLYHAKGYLLAGATVMPDGSSAYTATLSKPEGVAYAKVYLWEDISGIKPLCESKKIPVN